MFRHSTLILTLLLSLFSSSLYAEQLNNAIYGQNVPTCISGDALSYNGVALVCVTPGGGGLSTGSIILSLTTCPAGYTEATEFNGVTVVGTLAANKDVGTTGGNDNITPAGTNQALTFTGSSASTNNTSAGTPAGTNSIPIFTGSALAAHAHELPWQIPTTTTIRQIAVATFGTGTSRAATAVSAAGTANTTSAAVALSQSITAGTPTGTVTAPTFTGNLLGTHGHTVTATGTINTPSFTGTQFDNRSAFVKAIFCKKS